MVVNIDFDTFLVVHILLNTFPSKTWSMVTEACVFIPVSYFNILLISFVFMQLPQLFCFVVFLSSSFKNCRLVDRCHESMDESCLEGI